MGDRRLPQSGESRSEKVGKPMDGQLFAVSVIGQSIDGGVQAELTNSVFTDPSIQHFQRRKLIDRHHTSFVFHKSAQHRLEDFAGHALKTFVRLGAEPLVFVIEQTQIHLGDPT